MNNQFKFKLLLIAVLASGPLLARAAVTDSLRFGMFGQVTIYKPAGEP